MAPNIGINCSVDHCFKSDSNEEVEQFPRNEAPIKEEEAMKKNIHRKTERDRERTRFDGELVFTTTSSLSFVSPFGL